jgi:hypothetical protein
VSARRLLPVALAALIAVPSFAIAAEPAAAADDAAAAPVPPTRVTAGPLPTAELTAAIRRADTALFDAYFIRCDPAAVAGLVADDFEFYHDKSGLNTTSGQQFVDDLRKSCERREKGEDFTARRELVPESLEVFPLNQYGAIEIGVHRFFRTYPDGRPDEPTEIARFTMVWKQDGDTWRLTRVLSYDHRPAAAAAK